MLGKTEKEKYKDMLVPQQEFSVYGPERRENGEQGAQWSCGLTRSGSAVKQSGRKCDPCGATGDKDASFEAAEEREIHSLKSWAGMGLHCS